MQSILLDQRLGADRIPRLLPFKVGHKTGDVTPFVANDVGIIYSPGGPIAIAVLVGDNRTSPTQIDQEVGRIARVVVEVLDDSVVLAK
jgi:hypothetical protein